MQRLAALILTTFVLATPAFASWIAPVDANICTRDFNAWGQASVCQCPHATRYENRIGQCVQGAPVDLSVEGTVALEQNLDGDVVAYSLIKNENEAFHIVMPMALRAVLQDPAFTGVRFRITGEVLENFDGSEIAVPTLILQKLEPLDLLPEHILPNLPDLQIAD